jgi:hypothetical protein
MDIPRTLMATPSSRPLSPPTKPATPRLFWAIDNDNHPDGTDSAFLTRDGSQLTPIGKQLSAVAFAAHDPDWRRHNLGRRATGPHCASHHRDRLRYAGARHLGGWHHLRRDRHRPERGTWYCGSPELRRDRQHGDPGRGSSSAGVRHHRQFADFNGDGKSDIVWPNDNGTPSIWLMNGTSVLSSATLPSSGPAPRVGQFARFHLVVAKIDGIQ